MAEKRDPASRLRDLVDTAEPRLRRRFLEMIAIIKSGIVLQDLERLITQGRFEEGLQIVERAAAQFARELTAVFIEAGASTSTTIGDAMHLVIDFDQTNHGAVALMRQNRLELVHGFTEEQRQVTRQALLDGITDGLNPREQAIAFRDAIGLTQRQQQAVRNYERLLQEGSAEALSRQLRDRRFDGAVERASMGGEPLTGDQIDMMVGRYTERYIKYRSEVIARTEALRSAHQGSEEAYRQAFESGDLEPEQVIRVWNTAGDGRKSEGGRVRDAHADMEGQERDAFEAFTDGDGNSLMYPGDPSAPPETSIQCRCAVSVRIQLKSLEAVEEQAA